MLEWINGYANLDTPDGKYLIRFDDGTERAIVLRNRMWEPVLPGRCVAHAFLEPLPPIAASVEVKAVEMPAWPLLARWVKSNGKAVAAVKIEPLTDSQPWRFVTASDKFVAWINDNEIPATAERLDPNSLAARIRELESERDGLKAERVRLSNKLARIHCESESAS